MFKQYKLSLNYRSKRFPTKCHNYSFIIRFYLIQGTLDYPHNRLAWNPQISEFNG